MTERLYRAGLPSEIKLTLLYFLKKSYLKRNTVSKLHKTFESFFDAGEHKGEIAPRAFAKWNFCRKLYVVQGRYPGGCRVPPEKAQSKRGTSKMKMLSGFTEQNTIRAVQGHRAALCKALGRAYAEIKAVVQVYHSFFFVLQTEKERFGYDSESCSDHGLGQ